MPAQSREMLNVNLWQKIFQSRNIHKFQLCLFNWNIQLEFDEFGQRLPAMHLCHLSILQIILLRVKLNLLHSARQNEQHKKNKFFEGDTRWMHFLVVGIAAVVYATVTVFVVEYYSINLWGFNLFLQMPSCLCTHKFIREFQTQQASKKFLATENLTFLAWHRTSSIRV